MLTIDKLIEVRTLIRQNICDSDAVISVHVQFGCLSIRTTTCAAHPLGWNYQLQFSEKEIMIHLDASLKRYVRWVSMMHREEMEAIAPPDKVVNHHETDLYRKQKLHYNTWEVKLIQLNLRK